MDPFAVLTKEDLDGLTCAVPGCKHGHQEGSPMFLHGRCHLSAGTEVEYKLGVVTVRCVECKRHIAAIKVAAKAS